jgi:hypothetical protein
MGVEIPNGAVATLICSVNISSASFGATADSIIALIRQELIGDGLTIARADVNATGIFFPLTGEFSATFQILNQSGQELDDSDLLSQFSDAVSQIGGNVVTAGVTEVVGSDSGVNSGTGSHGNVTAVGEATGSNNSASSSTAHACGDPSWSFFQDPAQYISCLTTKGLSTVGLIAIGLLVGIVLIVAVERRPGVV